MDAIEREAEEAYRHSTQRAALGVEWADLTYIERRGWLARAARKQQVIRPRPGDLAAATQKHVPVPSGEYVLGRKQQSEKCDLCGLVWGSPLHIERPKDEVLEWTLDEITRFTEEEIGWVWAGDWQKERFRAAMREALRNRT